LGATTDLVNYYIQLLAIMNPFSAIPTFLSLTDSMDSTMRREILRKALWAMLILVAMFTLIGVYLLYAFSLSINALRVGGGILLLYIGLDMLGGMPRSKRVEASDVAVVPIATPLIVGPGTITTLLLLTTSRPSLVNTLTVLVSGILAVLTTYTLLYYSEKIVIALRPSVVRGIGKFMSLIIVSVAVEMIFIGSIGLVRIYTNTQIPLQ
jgi:multiple antibiotic resistance protein